MIDLINPQVNFYTFEPEFLNFKTTLLMAKKTILKYLLFTLISALLFSLSNGIFRLGIVSIFSFVPFIFVVKNNSIIQTATYSAIFFIIILISKILFFEELSVYNFRLHLIELIIFCAPWILYNFIRSRHNDKLGNLMLISSWLTVDWISEQYLGLLNNLQLGDLLCSFPQIVGWYEFTGAGGGTILILVSNLVISNFIWSSKPTQKKGLMVDYCIFVLLPLLFSILNYGKVSKSVQTNISLTSSIDQISQSNPTIFNLMEDSLNKSNNVKMIDGSIVIKSKRQSSTFYSFRNDSIDLAKKVLNDSFYNIDPVSLKTQDIFGFHQQKIFITNLKNQKITLVNTPSLSKNELIRINTHQNTELIAGFENKSTGYNSVYLGSVISRALENRINILYFDKKGNSTIVYPDGHFKINTRTLKMKETTVTFFRQYGNIIGRLSIFTTIWFIFGAFVKPFRKNNFE